MNKQIRQLGIGLMVMFCLLIAQLTRVQIVDSHDLSSNPKNARNILREFNAPRGVIQTSDGVVLAKSVIDKQGRFVRRRVYPEGDLYSQFVGYYSFLFGASGLEQEYDEVLRGKKTSLGNSLRPLFEKDFTSNITLTINSKIQKAAQEQLGNRKGAVVVMDPRDGSMLAAWSYPSYDPNGMSAYSAKVERATFKKITTDPDKPAQARAYQRTYPPGSTFKTVTASTVLQLEPELNTKVYPTLRELPLPGTVVPLHNFGGSACGGIMFHLLTVSCNTGFAQIGMDLGAEKLHRIAEAYGFNVKSADQPLDVPAVASSIFPDTSAFVNDTAALAKSAIGQQDVRSTPLQMALVAAGVGNKGNVMKPHFLKEVRDNEGSVISKYKPSIWQRPLSITASEQLRDMMINVVAQGTGTRAQIPGITVAGKTGTAQTVGDNSHAWFVGFAPAEAPRVAVAVIVESQPGLGDSVTGGLIAAPIAQSVMQTALAELPNP